MTPATKADIDTSPDGRTTAEFETAQRQLFEEHGLDVNSRFVTFEKPQKRIHVFEAGRSDEEPPVVFVHGTASFGAFLAPLMAQVEGTRTVAFDRPGYGLSEPFIYTKENIQRTVVDVLAGVLDELGMKQVDLVGHSMGGHTSILFALAHPDRVRQLTLVGSVPAFPGTRPPMPLRLLTVPLLGRLIQRLQKSGEEGVLDIAEIFGEREAIQQYPALIQAIAAHERDQQASEAGVSEFNALFSVRGWHPSVRLREAALRNLQQPTTIIWGDHDPLGEPDDVRDGIGWLPHARLEIVDAGHIPYLANLERCGRIIRKTREGDKAF